MILICKNCGSELVELICHGKAYLKHSIDFGDCKPEINTKVR